MRALLGLVLATPSLLVGTAAAQSLDFSGAYTLVSSSGDFEIKKSAVWTLDVAQSGTAIRVTKVRNGRSFVNTFPLDGTDGAFSDPGGLVGKCKGHFK